MIKNIKEVLKEKVNQTLNYEVVIEVPRFGDADLAIPLFQLAKMKNENPKNIFLEFEFLNSLAEIEKTKFVNGFLNIYLNRNISKTIIDEIYNEKSNYASMPINGETIVIDYSSPNIAKSFGVGHLRSTVIGHSIKHIYEKLGYKVIGVNHLGDWGTQFGKMIIAYQKWGKKSEIEKAPIEALQALYVKFHEEEKTDPSLTEKARLAFLRLEQNDPEMIELWQWFKDESMKEFVETYKLLNVEFDSNAGESFYNDKMDSAIKELEAKGLLEIDDGATIVSLDDLPPALIKKSDGATLYMTRDLAALLYRYNTYKTNNVIYVVGNEQALHFKQLQSLIHKMGYDINVIHIGFGLVLMGGKKMSTRSGTFKRLDDVIHEAIRLADVAISSKNPNLANKGEVAIKIGVGAIIFNDLKNERHLNIDFNLENMLKFEGQTGPYLQYSGVRINSILRANELSINDIDYTVYETDEYYNIIKYLGTFKENIERAKTTNMPSVIAKYLIDLAQMFNSFYGNIKIVTDNLTLTNTNLLFITAIKEVLQEGMRILGISYLEEM